MLRCNIGGNKLLKARENTSVQLKVTGKDYQGFSKTFPNDLSQRNTKLGVKSFGLRYEGYFDGEKNIEHGRGKLISQDGASFEEFRKGKKFKRRRKTPDGSILDGEWKNDQLVKVRLSFQTVNLFRASSRTENYQKNSNIFQWISFDGSFNTEVKPHGNGKLFWPDGSSFDGKFVDGKP